MEDVARAVGAASTEKITIKGIECTVKPLTLKDLTEVERICLDKYRRSYVKTFADNADLLGPVEGPKLVREKLEEAARWDVSSLPRKDAYDPARMVLTPEIIKWVETNVPGWSIDEKETEARREKLLRRAVASMLDSGDLSPEQYTKLTGNTPVAFKIGYVNWWVTAVQEGMITMVTQSIKDNGVTYEDVVVAIGKNPSVLINLSREIEHLSVPEVKNG